MSTSAPAPAGRPTDTRLVAHAVRTGLSRGWTEFKLSMRAPDDLVFISMWSLGLVVYLWFNRSTTVDGTDLTVPALVLPGALAAMVVFGSIIGPAFALVVEKEDGTLLRVRSAPRGLVGYVSGQVVLQGLGVLPMVLLVLVPSVVLFDGVVQRGAAGALAAAGFTVLGIVASLPLGMIIGSLASKPAHVSTWGLLPVFGLVAISGVFVPLQAMWGWVQTVAQAFPMYWLGVGLRWSFLPPEAAAAFEPTGTSRPGHAVVVLLLWIAVGLVVTPVVLRRMARRESGAALQERQRERMQRYG